MITPGGVVTTLAGSSSSGYQNGAGGAALFSSPAGLAVDLAGDVFVADAGNNVIREITPGGVVSTLAGVAPTVAQDIPGFVNGAGANARFALPLDVAVDNNTGDVYVADFDNNAIREITPGGVVTTLAGAPNRLPGDGPVASAGFSAPDGVAVDNSGLLVYVSRRNDESIRRIANGMVTTLAGPPPSTAVADGSDYNGSNDGMSRRSSNSTSRRPSRWTPWRAMAPTPSTWRSPPPTTSGS